MFVAPGVIPAKPIGLRGLFVKLKGRSLTISALTVALCSALSVFSNVASAVTVIS